MHHPTDRIAHTMAFDTPVVDHWLEREIAQWVHPMKDRSDDPSHHKRTLLPRSYISLLSREVYEGSLLLAINFQTISIAVVCAVMFVHIKDPLLLMERVDHVVVAAGFLSR